MRETDITTAERFHITEKCQKLETELLEIEGVTEIEFDLRGFYSDIYEVIISVKYSLPVKLKSYYEKRKELIESVIGVAEGNFLTRSGDQIEDSGEHLYFVFECCEEWRKLNG